MAKGVFARITFATRLGLEKKNAPEGASLLTYWRSGRLTHPNSLNSTMLYFSCDSFNFIGNLL
jgi:hypothetical protein